MQEYEHEELFDVIDELILGVYMTEILLKWYCSFTMFWRCGWNVFDLAIVVIMLAGVRKYTQVYILADYRHILPYFYMEIYFQTRRTEKSAFPLSASPRRLCFCLFVSVCQQDNLKGC